MTVIDSDLWPGLIRRARSRLLELHYRAKAGHIGGNLSCIDCLVVLYHEVLKEDDVLILSKGHSAGALYTALWSCGLLEEETLQTFACDGTFLGVHPPFNRPEVAPFGTGSLGHGPSLAAGIALGRRLQNKTGRVFCLCSDGEWQEGSCWEALSFAAHQRLEGLRLIVDVNGWQGFGSTLEVASVDINTLAARFEAFGASVRRCDGHAPGAILESLTEAPLLGQPNVLLLRTCKGKGLSFFEDSLASHYLPLTDTQYEAARQEL
ncbi:MAG TPA: transketolase, partial [Syntrophobacteraceae bacterium]|nr:transketolase [Syntrophobacteraceae bacterium]